jgi:hypothetical protein
MVMGFMSGGGKGYSGPAFGWWWVGFCILVGVVVALMMEGRAWVKTSLGSWLYDLLYTLLSILLP